MSDESGRHSKPTRRPDPTLGRRLSSRPQFPPVRPEGSRGAHRKREEPEQPQRPERRRVVLADPRKNSNSMRPRVELEEHTTWGTGMVTALAQQQLRAALCVAAVVVVLLGALPVAYYVSPTFANLTVLGVPVAWGLLGVAPFPLLFGAGLWYNHMADRNERVFVRRFGG